MSGGPAEVIERVVVPLDGSERAESALGPGVQLADRLGARLVLLSARWQLTPAETVARYLDTRIAFLGHDAEPLVVLDRDGPEAIVLAAGEPGTLVCMATHGRGGLSQAVLGSVAAATIRQCSAPVVFVGPNLAVDWTLPTPATVVTGFDGSETAAAGARAAARFARAVGARVEVVEVEAPRDVIALPRQPAGHVEALEALTVELRSFCADVSSEVIRGYDAADSLIAYVLERGAAFLALGTHGRSGIPRVVMGSVATRAIRHAPVPVLTVRA